LKGRFVEQDYKKAVSELCAALFHTVDYVGVEMLPPIEGWSWYDAMCKYSPESVRGFEISFGILNSRRKHTAYNDQLQPKGNVMRPDHNTVNNPCGSAILITRNNIKLLRIINGGVKLKGKKKFLKKDHYFYLPDYSTTFTDVLPAKEFFATYKFMEYPDSHCLIAVRAL